MKLSSYRRIPLPDITQRTAGTQPITRIALYRCRWRPARLAVRTMPSFGICMVGRNASDRLRSAANGACGLYASPPNANAPRQQ